MCWLLIDELLAPLNLKKDDNVENKEKYAHFMDHIYFLSWILSFIFLFILFISYYNNHNINKYVGYILMGLSLMYSFYVINMYKKLYNIDTYNIFMLIKILVMSIGTRLKLFFSQDNTFEENKKHVHIFMKLIGVWLFMTLFLVVSLMPLIIFYLLKIDFNDYMLLSTLIILTIVMNVLAYKFRHDWKTVFVGSIALFVTILIVSTKIYWIPMKVMEIFHLGHFKSDLFITKKACNLLTNEEKEYILVNKHDFCLLTNVFIKWRIGKEILVTMNLQNRTFSQEEIIDYSWPPRKRNAIYFDFNSSKLTIKSKQKLFDISEKLKLNKDLEINLRAHSSVEGTEKYNYFLAKKRLETVSLFLEANDILKTKLHLDTKGTEEILKEQKVKNILKESRRIDYNFFYNTNGKKLTSTSNEH